MRIDTLPTTYVLDHLDRVLSVSGPWDEFADANGGTRCSSAAVCGRRIWAFVAGDATRMWLDALFQHARLRRTTIERPYRCDSPDVKRFMRMRIVPEAEGVLRVEHEVLFTEPRPPLVSIQYASGPKGGVRQRCSVCGRVKDRGWQEPRPDHADASNRIVVLYTVCDHCWSEPSAERV